MPCATLIRKLAITVLMLGAAGVSAGPYSAYVILGDSQSDPGNNALLTPNRSLPPYEPVAFFPYPGGTYSNGPIWADYVSGRFSKRAKPSLAGGTNFAFGGARITNGINPQTDLTAQAAALLVAYGVGSGGSLPSDALYMLWGGSNDTFDAMRYFLTDPTQPNRLEEAQAQIHAALDAYGDIIRGLALSGAEHMLVLSMGDGGLAPVYRDSPIEDTAREFTQYFNLGLSALLDALDEQLTDLDLMRFDVYGFTTRVFNDPAAFGLTNVTEACIRPGTEVDPVCSDPNDHLFWDFVHSTTTANALLADEILAQVPLPATPLLVLTGLLALGQRRRRGAA